MKRWKIPKRKDRKLFTRTASKVKAVNLPKRVYRGGIRL